MNLTEAVLDCARLNPSRLAVSMGAVALDYKTLWETSGRVAAELVARGIGRGDRVLLYADNCPEFFVLYLASARIGAIFAPVHSSFQALELEYVLSNSSAGIIYVEESLYERIEGNESLERLLPDHVVKLGVSGGGSQAPMWATLTQGLVENTVENVDSDTPALISYTSGSRSANPTPVTRSHGGEAWNASTYQDIWDIRAHDNVLVSLPLSWVYGLSTVGLAALYSGATVVLQGAGGADPLLPAIAQHEISIFAGTMTMYSRLLAELQERNFDHSSLRHMYVGGESVSLPVIRLIEHYTGVRPLQAYAKTEVAPVLAVDPVRDISAPEGTAGRRVEGSEVRLVDAKGRDVGVGEVGEAWIRGRGSMLGYWNEPALTNARTAAGGWFKTGDFLWCDRDGYYFMVGRDDDVIIREGSKVSVSEVESAIVNLEGIEDVVVVGVEDDEFGEAAIAFVVGARGTTRSIDSIYDELGTKIARFKLPREIYLLKEIPLGVTGKRDRRQLKQLARTKTTEDNVVVTMADWLASRSRGLGAD